MLSRLRAASLLKSLTPLAAGLLAACAATASGAKGIPAEVTYRMYPSDVELTIVNESHTDKLEKYSTVGANASLKVAPDEVVAELLKLEQRFGLQTQPGLAPPSANDPALASIEIIEGGVPRHAMLVTGVRQPGFAEYQLNFIELYNNIYAPQAVDADASIFDER